MLPESAQAALTLFASLAREQPSFDDALHAHWVRAGGRVVGRAGTELPENYVAMAADLDATLTTLAEGHVGFGDLLAAPSGEILFCWISANVWRRDIELAPLLRAAAEHEVFRARVPSVARDRVVEGPLLDALTCAPFLGDGDQLGLPENAEARARLEILVWEAGASALEVPALGPWIWGSSSTFEAMLRDPARGALRGRVLAARCLEVSIGGMPGTTDPELVGRTLQVLQPLLLHPEPLVWVHAARALGRMIGPVEQLEGTLLDWVQGESRLLRQRALTAFASLPSARLNFLLASQLVALLEATNEEDWVVASIAAATPYLFFERRDLWDRLAKRVLADGRALSARALARGLATLWRRGMRSRVIEDHLRALRELARRTRTPSLDESRRWIEIIAVTDAIDDAERDPLDLELGIENLVRIAAQYDDEEADARAARFAASVAPTFGEARRIALGKGRIRQRAAAVNAVEGAARSLALRLWAPLLATRPHGEGVEEPKLEATWEMIARAPAEILELVKEHRQDPLADLDASLALEILAVRLGGYALDACGEDSDLGPGGGPVAHDTCLWLRKIDGLADGSRELPMPLKNALSMLFWRLVDTTRGTALGEVDDLQWLGPFAAWWALVIDRPAMLQQLAVALPMMSADALTKCCEHADALRTAVSSGTANGAWGGEAATALGALHAVDTELASALASLATALADFNHAAGPKADLDELCVELVLAADRLHGALANPLKALHPATPDTAVDSLSRSTTENAPRVAALVGRAIRARDLSMLEVWFAALGPVASALIEAAVQAAIRRTPPPPPTQKKGPQVIEGYELVKPLGEGGIGKVWLVRKPGADRYFVLKIPKADALANATATERAGILASFVEEAKALAGLYHPNVANIIDRGVVDDVPFLVLEYLIGADLKQYSSARPMTLFELRQVVLDTCAGLSALHTAGLVHRDIKPANLWIRLPLQGGVIFEPERHRDPAHTMPLATVVIDFGMVRAIRVPPEVGGRFVAGTAGYIAPEQVLDPVVLDPRSDVYALAGTIYNCTTGRAFFDDIENPRDRIIAHMRRDPFEDAERLKGYPAAIAKLLRAATAKEAADRPSPQELGREFAAAL